MTGAETQKLGTCSPQNKGSPPRPGPWFPPRFSPPPSSGDLNANKAAAPGAWRSLACGRPLSDQYPGAGRAGGWGYAHPQSSAPSPQPSLSPLFQARDGPRGALPGSAHPTVPPTPALPKAGKPAAPGWGLEACGAGRCAPHPCPPRAAGRERRSNPRLRGPAWAGSLAFQDTPPPQSGGRGTAAGKSDPTTSASVQARPKLSDAGGEPGATRGLGEDPGRGPDSTEDPPLSLASLPLTSPRFRTLRLRAPLAPLPRPREAVCGGCRKGLGRTAVSATAPPCAPRLSLACAAAPTQIGDKATIPEPWAPAPRSPRLTHLFFAD